MHSVPAKMLRSLQSRNLNKAPRRRPYCCDACAKQFETPSKLARHYLTHTGLKPFPCPDCSKTFRQLAHLERHVMTHMLPLSCDTCHRHFKTFETFSKHQQLPCAGPVKEARAPKRSPAPAPKNVLSLPQYCFGCQRTFANEEKRLLHQCEFMNVAAIQKVQTRRCEFCDKVFPSRSKLERHLMIHTGQKPFACSLCDRTFRQKTHLKIHELTHSEEKPFQCHQCPKAFKMAEKLLKHQGVHKIFSTVSRRERSPSAEPVEVKQEAEEAFSVFVIPFQCSSCGQCFEKQENLDNHECITEANVSEAATSSRVTCNGGSKIREHLLDDEILPDGRVMKAEHLEEPNHMNIGDAETQHLSVSKNLHIRKPWGENIQQPRMDMERYFQAQELGMTFPRLLENSRSETICRTFHAYDQDQHGQQSHSLHQFLQGAQGILLRKRNVAKCDQCSKTFPTMSKLRRHYLTHTGQKPFTCDECGKTFRQTAHLKRHLVIHVLKAPVLGSPSVLGDYYSTLCQQQTISFPLSQHCDSTVNTDELDQVKTIVVPDIKVESESMDLSSGSQKAGTCKNARMSVRKERKAKSNPQQKVSAPAVKKSYSCSVCTKTFLSPSKLERHYLMHAGQRPFQCTECGKSFRQDPHLKRHMMTHTQMKKKIEDVCVS
ncbi:zinc finger protein 770 [Phyllobates terribilis]|uniref:zinc finger protein 770 n=1 Tax=Phyllobates terribilis TaxID=111132 RepID=UPI003CCB20B9